jgi:hypothetical protein
MMNRDYLFCYAALLGVTLLVGGCGEAETSPVTITESRVMAEHDQRLGRSNQERFGGPMPAAQELPPGAEAVAATGGFAYQLPAEWRELPAAPMRAVNLQVPGGAECYLSVTLGGAQAIRSNLDRWRGQLGLPPLSDEAFAALPQQQMLGDQALLMEAEGAFRGMGAAEVQDDYAVHGLILARGEEVITLKLVGPAAVVAEQQAALLAFAASLEAAP